MIYIYSFSLKTVNPRKKESGKQDKTKTTTKMNGLHQHGKFYILQKAEAALLPIAMITRLRVYPKYFFTKETTSKFARKFMGCISYEKIFNMYPVLKLILLAPLFF